MTGGGGICCYVLYLRFFFQAEDGIRDLTVTGVQTCALPISPLQLSIVYPGPTDVVQAHDSCFLFGAVRGGAGPVTLSVNGTPVRVFANGAWIAWLPLPDDTLAVFRLVARADGDSALQDWTARISPALRPPAGRAAWIDTKIGRASCRERV